MTNLDKAIDRIKVLECPTGELEERIVNIFEDYRVANRNEVIVKRDEGSDKDDLEAYRIEFTKGKEGPILVFAKAGMDDYVVKVFKVKPFINK
ncbi:MAG: hypothetical protein GX080_00245 [Tissierellia bacterium]|nr:hypothetical protein [Tissierellia bacterium]